MQTTTYHASPSTGVRGYILDVPGLGRTPYLEISDGDGNVTIIVRSADLLDKLSNEADRLCREFVGDVP